MTKMIVGLGNPGDKYAHTKHNIGFDVLDILANRYNLNFTRNQTFLADTASTFIDGEKIILVKPITFMNESGQSVKPLLAYNGLNKDDLVVIYDDLDLSIGQLRLRQKGSAGGHNGIKSIISHLGSQDFKRLKIGIGRPKHGMSVVNHVLGRFEQADQSDVENGLLRAADAIEHYININDFNQTGNKFNG